MNVKPVRESASMMMLALCLLLGPLAASGCAAERLGQGTSGREEYRLLATSRTSSLQYEMQHTAQAGFRLVGVACPGGLIAVMERPAGAEPRTRYEYRVLAATSLPTLEREMQEAAQEGFQYRAHTAGLSTSRSIFFGGLVGQALGAEMIVAMERDLSARPARSEYRLVAANRADSMAGAIQSPAADGFRFAGLASGFKLGQAAVLLRPVEGEPRASFEYKITRDLQTASEEGYVPVGLWDGSTVVMERQPQAKPARCDYKLVSAIRSGTWKKNLAAAVAEGYRYGGLFLDGAILMMRTREAGTTGKPDYRLLDVTRIKTLEREIRQAVAEGYSLRAYSLGAALMERRSE